MKTRLAYAAFLLLLVGAAELAVRLGGLDLRLLPPLLFYQEALPSLHEPDPDPWILYRLRPGARAELRGRAYTTNSLGFRDPERSAAKPAGVTRVVCLGGSNTFGAAVPDGQTYPAQLEKALNADFQGRFEVWNAGLSASVPGQNAELAEEILQRYDPDVLIFQKNNAGRRAFLPGQDYRSAFRKDPGLWIENLRCLPAPDRAWGRVLARGALWRAAAAALSRSQRMPVLNPRYASDEPNRLRFQAFWQRHRAELPIFLMDNSGQEGGDWGAPELGLFERDSLPEVPCREYLYIHPPACAYRWYAQAMAWKLSLALPGKFRPKPGWKPARDTCRKAPEPGFEPLASEDQRARAILARWAEGAPADAGLRKALSNAACSGGSR
ncbi:MAG: hypothetical protein PHU21_10115 [Elusimicrobia bacterium]|nr:hypothetical protein [Elusimicrobiota bacterium]